MPKRKPYKDLDAYVRALERKQGLRPPKKDRRKDRGPRFEPIPDDTPILCLDVSSTALGWAVAYREPYGMRVRSTAFGVKRFDLRTNQIAHKRIDELCTYAIDRAREVYEDDHKSIHLVMEWSAGFAKYGHGRMRGLAILGQAQGAVWQALLRSVVPIGTCDLVDEKSWTKSKPKHERGKLMLAYFPGYAQWAGRWKGGERGPHGDPGWDTADALGIALWRLTR